MKEKYGRSQNDFRLYIRSWVNDFRQAHQTLYRRFQWWFSAGKEELIKYDPFLILFSRKEAALQVVWSDAKGKKRARSPPV